MTDFKKLIIGLAEAAIAQQSCGHSGNWRLPCSNCNDLTGKVYDQIARAISDEGSRRHMEAGHDARDGNRPHRKNRVVGYRVRLPPNCYSLQPNPSYLGGDRHTDVPALGYEYPTIREAAIARALAGAPWIDKAAIVRVTRSTSDRPKLGGAK